MEPKRKNGNKKKTHNAVVSTVTFSQKQLEKFGLLRRFLDWIARGVEESHRGKTSCPT